MSSDTLKVEDFLPLHLQDLCLLRVINDLDAYPVGLLASLPRWLRHWLLSNLPVLDLCRLDHTLIARDIQEDEFWKPLVPLTPCHTATRRHQHRKPERASLNQTSSMKSELDHIAIVSNKGVYFNLDVSQLQNPSMKQSIASCRISRLHVSSQTRINLSLIEELEVALKNVKESKSIVPARDDFLLKETAGVLSNKHNPTQLALIEGAQLLQNLIPGYSVTKKLSYQVWKKQATALRKQLSIDITDLEEMNKLSLLPHRLQMVTRSYDKKWLLSRLVDNCHSLPASAYVHVNSLPEDIQRDLRIESFAQNCGLKLSDDSQTYSIVLNSTLKQVEVLLLRCDNYSCVGVVIGIIKAATLTGDECRLKHLFCTLPDLYTDLVQPLSSLFSLRNFQKLFLELDEVCLTSLSKLIFDFMTSPCSSLQNLTIKTNECVPFPETLDPSDLATLKMDHGAAVPQCAIEHKELHISWTGVIYLLLQLPTIRLNEICIANYKCLHLAALHPDLLVMKLTIVMERYVISQSEFQQDLVHLLKMPTLQELTIDGNWCHEVAVGLAEAFQQRGHLPPFKKITLHATTYGPTTEDYRLLWKAIFTSLRRLDQLEIVLGYGCTEIYKSWVETEASTQLKSLTITPKVSEIDSHALSQFTQQYFTQ